MDLPTLGPIDPWIHRADPHGMLVSEEDPAGTELSGSAGEGGRDSVPQRPLIRYQELSTTTDSDVAIGQWVVCLTEIQHAPFSSDTKRCLTVKSKSVCSHSNCMFCPTIVGQCPSVDRYTLCCHQQNKFA